MKVKDRNINEENEMMALALIIIGKCVMKTTDTATMNILSSKLQMIIKELDILGNINEYIMV
jgi:hypothetical protein